MTYQKKLGQRGIYSGLISGTGYLYIPSDISDRDKFISDCFNTCSVSFLTIEGQRFDDVQVSKNLFKDLEFPDEKNDVGSLIFWVKHQKHNKPIIVGVLCRKGEALGYQRYEFLLNKQTETGLVKILGI